MNKLVIKNWVLTPHAATRVAERAVTMDEIQEVLDNPDVIKEQGTKFILAKHLASRSDNMIACVVIERKENGLWVIITVMHNFKEN